MACIRRDDGNSQSPTAPSGSAGLSKSQKRKARAKQTAATWASLGVKPKSAALPRNRIRRRGQCQAASVSVAPGGQTPAAEIRSGDSATESPGYESGGQAQCHAESSSDAPPPAGGQTPATEFSHTQLDLLTIMVADALQGSAASDMITAATTAVIITALTDPDI